MLKKFLNSLLIDVLDLKMVSRKMPEEKFLSAGQKCPSET